MLEGSKQSIGSETLSPARTYRGRQVSRTDALAAASKRADALGNLRLLVAFLALVLILLPLFVRDGAPWWGLVPLFAAFLVVGKWQD